MASRPTLNKLLIKYSKHQVEWYSIGLQLGIEKHVLDIIKSDYQNKSADCFREMLTHWLNNDQSATKFRLQKAIEVITSTENETQRKSTNSLLFSVNQQYKALALTAVVMPIISVMMYMTLYYQYDNSPIKAAAETLKNEYRAHKVIKFSLPISDKNDLEYLGVVMKNINGHKFGVSELVRNYSGEGGRLIVSGQPGSGKTTLLRHLAREWANGRALQSCQILFLISLGSLEVKANTLSDLLSKSGFGDITNLKEVSEKIFATNGAGACFFFDAYDELKWDRYDFIDTIMEGSKVHSSFCLLTSRPFSGEKFSSQTRFEILGFNVDDLSYYLHQLSDNTTLINAIQHYWNNNTNVKQMCTVPLHMVMMLYIHRFESSESIRTITQLYIAFMNTTIKHYEGYHHEWNTESLWQCIRAEGPHGDNLCSAFNILHQVAYDMFFKDQDKFHDVKGTKEYIKQLGFVGVTSVPGSKSQVKFIFSHPTFLEFFAALHLTTLPLNEQLAFIAVHVHPYNTNFVYKLLYDRMYDKFYIGLTGDIFNYNTSGALPILRQMFLNPYVEIFGPCLSYRNVEKIIGWTTQQFGHAIDSALKLNYSLCAHQPCFTLEQDRESGIASDLIIRHDGKLELRIFNLISTKVIIVEYTKSGGLTKQDQLDLLYCIQGLEYNQDSICHRLRLPSVTSLTIPYYPYADILYKIKRVLPNLECLYIIVIDKDWNNHGTEFLSKGLKQHEITLELLNLQIHLSISIDRCSTKMSPYFDEIKHVSLRHVTVSGWCHNNYIQHLCTNVLQLSFYVQGCAHAQSLVNCIKQAQNVRMFELTYFYERAMDRQKQKEIFKNLPLTLQMLKIHVHRFDLSIHRNKFDVKLMVDSLIVKKNLRTLTLSIYNVEDMKILTQLTFLVHLHIVLDEFLLDKSTLLLIVHNLKHFPYLESFTLTANCHDLSDYDKWEILSTIFNITPARDIQICSTKQPRTLPPKIECSGIVNRHMCMHGIEHHMNTTCI